MRRTKLAVHLAFGALLGAHGHARAATWTYNSPPGSEGATAITSGPSLVIDAAGNWHAASVGGDGDLRYFKRTTAGVWTVQALDNTGGALWYTAIAVAPSGAVHIAYYGSDGLRYAKHDGVSWSTSTVDATGYGGAGVGARVGLELDAGGNAHISYYAAAPQDLKYAKWTGAAWSLETVASTGQVGVWNSLDLDSAGRPHISYDDSGKLMYAKWTGAAWSIEIADPGANAPGTDLALDSSDLPHIVYLTDSPGDLRYARWTGSSWQIQTVNTGVQIGATIALNPADRPLISYRTLAGHVHYGIWAGSFFTLQRVSPEGAEAGAMPAIALDAAGQPFIAHQILATNAVAAVAGTLDGSAPTGVPGTPVSPASSASGSVEFDWTYGTAADAESGIYGFHLQIGTSAASGDSSAFDGFVPNSVSYTLAGAQSGRTYYARLRAVNTDGLFSSFSSWSSGTLVDSSTPAAPTSIVSLTHPTGTTSYAVVSPRFIVSGPADASGIAGYHWNVDRSSWSVPTATHAFVAGSTVATALLLADGTWYFHAAAKDNAGNVGADAIHYKFIVGAAVNPAAANAFNTADGVQVIMPAGAVGSATSIVIDTPADGGPPASSGLTATGAIWDLSLADGTKQLQRGVTVTLPYTAAQAAGLDEGSLRLFFYDEAAGWTLVRNSSVDTLTRRVTGVVDHFTLFAVLAYSPAAAPLERLTNYPNPFSPLLGQQTRIRFFLDTSRDVRLRIYDAFGRKVLERAIAGVTGPNEVVWDGRSGDGRHVESGGYIAVLESGGATRKARIGVK